jgi:hypothetical protein
MVDGGDVSDRCVQLLRTVTGVDVVAFVLVLAKGEEDLDFDALGGGNRGPELFMDDVVISESGVLGICDPRPRLTNGCAWSVCCYRLERNVQRA